MNDIINSFSEDGKEPLTTVQPASTVDEIKYIVFKSSLLELFKQCTSCHNECIGKVAYQKGTFIAVKQVASCKLLPSCKLLASCFRTFYYHQSIYKYPL